MIEIVLFLEHYFVTKAFRDPGYILRGSHVVDRTRQEHSRDVVVIKRNQRWFRASIDYLVLHFAVIIKCGSVSGRHLEVVEEGTVALAAWLIA